MKSQILKHTGLTEKQFYAKYKTPKDFDNSKEGKAFKKAQSSSEMDKAQNFGNLNYMNDPRFGQTANYSNTQGYGYTPQVSGVGGNLQMAGMQPLGQSLSQLNPLPNSKQLMGNSGDKKGTPFNVDGAMNVFNGIKSGFDNIKARQKKIDSLQTWAGVTGVLKDAAISNAFVQKPQREWNSPDKLKNIVNASELYMPKGRGTDVYGQNGSMIGGNPTEIQNTYNDEYDIYTDLEDPNEVKAYQTGGGFGNFMSQLNGSLGGSATGGFMGNIGTQGPFTSMIAGDSELGGLGGTIGSIGGPGGAMLGAMVGKFFDKQPGQEDRAITEINSNQSFIDRINSGAGITNRLQGMGVGQNGEELATYEEGGYMNPEYNPQVITMFGDHTAADFADYAHKFRAGGHLKEYTPPSERAMQTYENGGKMNSYALGGKLKSYWGGEVNTIVKNPYLPGSGEIGMLSGATHDNGGIGISYTGAEDDYEEMAENGTEMGAQVEAETGEPIIEMAEGGSIDPKTGKANTSAVIFGNIPFSKKLANATGDEALIKLAKEKDGETYKKIIADFAAPQKKAEQTIIKASEIANKADNTKDGLLETNTAKMMKYGGEQTQKDYADLIMKLANLQNATQDVKKEKSYAAGYNLSAEELGKGNEVRDYDPITKDAKLENPYAKSGAFLRKAQNSTTVGDDANYVSKYGITPWQGNVGKGSKYGKATKSSFSTKQWDEVADKLGFKGKGNKEFQEFLLKNPESAPLIKARHEKLYGKDTPMIDEKLGYGWAADELLLPKAAEIPADTTTKQTTQAPKNTNVIPYQRNKLVDFANMISPFFQNDNLPDLDQRQLAKEYMAMANNTPYGVQAQQYFPELDPVYRVSYQDIMNQNTSDFRDVERQIGNNPAALANLLSGKYKANQPVKGEEFRTNQAIEQQIFGGNRAKVNQARATNLQLLADQRDKQLQADSITKTINQEAVGSIADKYLQHEARNDEYRVKRNLFPNYRYGQTGNIYNQGYTQLNIPQMYGNKASFKQVPVYGPNGEVTSYKLEPYDPSANGGVGTPPLQPVAKNGKSIVKNAKNSSVVKAFKNL